MSWFGNLTKGKANSRPAMLPVMLAVWLPVVTALATDTTAISNLTGQWHGQSRFTGISYEEATQKKVAPQDVEIVLHIAADGKATGRLGGAELTNCIVTTNRGWIGRKLHLWSDFNLRGQVVGAIAPGSESGIHSIRAPFNFDGTQLKGSVFVIYPVKYPYPFLDLRLRREP
jgi:hypothetical protein